MSDTTNAPGSDVVTLHGHPIHPAANLFPLLSEEETIELANDIQKSGQQQPIIRWHGQILDGRNRLRACHLMVKVPRIIDRDDIADPVAFVISLNLRRRHLTESQRAIIAARLVGLYEPAARERTVLAGKARQGDQEAAKQLAATPPVRTLEKAADTMQVSPRSVTAAKQVLKDGVPELVEKVEKGAVTVAAASDLAQLPKDKQREVLASADPSVVLAEAKKIRADRQQTNRAARTEKLAAEATGTAPLLSRVNGMQRPERAPLILCDWPWEYAEGTTDPSRAIAGKYPPLPLAEALKLPVAAITTPDALLFFWTVNPLLPEALRVIEAWGFTYKTNFAWDKEIAGGGYWARGQHELLIIATRGNMPKAPEAARAASVIRARRGEHSEKPAVVYEIIERMYPGMPKVEFFARATRAGWFSIGNQIDGRDIRDVVGEWARERGYVPNVDVPAGTVAELPPARITVQQLGAIDKIRVNIAVSADRLTVGPWEWDDEGHPDDHSWNRLIKGGKVQYPLAAWVYRSMGDPDDSDEPWTFVVYKRHDGEADDVIKGGGATSQEARRKADRELAALCEVPADNSAELPDPEDPRPAVELPPVDFGEPPRHEASRDTTPRALTTKEITDHTCDECGAKPGEIHGAGCDDDGRVCAARLLRDAGHAVAEEDVDGDDEDDDFDVHQTTCPKCGKKPGFMCVDKEGRRNVPRPTPHTERVVAAYKEHGRELPPPRCGRPPSMKCKGNPCATHDPASTIPFPKAATFEEIGAPPDGERCTSICKEEGLAYGERCMRAEHKDRRHLSGGIEWSDPAPPKNDAADVVAWKCDDCGGQFDTIGDIITHQESRGHVRRSPVRTTYGSEPVQLAPEKPKKQRATKPAKSEQLALGDAAAIVAATKKLRGADQPCKDCGAPLHYGHRVGHGPRWTCSTMGCPSFMKTNPGPAPAALSVACPLKVCKAPVGVPCSEKDPVVPGRRVVMMHPNRGQAARVEAAAKAAPPAAPKKNAKAVIKLSDEVRDVLSRSRIEGNRLYLPGQLDRKLYQRVDQALQALGGKWERGKKAHTFPNGYEWDVTIKSAVATGKVVDEDKALGFFSTKAHTADELVALAGIRPGMSVCEPSAGRGDLACAIAKRLGPGDRLLLVEVDPGRVKELRRMEKEGAFGKVAVEIVQRDFLVVLDEWLAPSDRFDRVVMNPPFHDERSHVQQAFDLLKPGGRLVSVMSGGIVFRDRDASFREWIDEHGRIEREQLPPDSFDGTSVIGCVVVLETEPGETRKPPVPPGPKPKRLDERKDAKLIQAIKDSNSVDTSSSDKIRRPVKIDDELYVYTGALSNGKGMRADLWRVVPAADYEDPTYTYQELVARYDRETWRGDLTGHAVMFGKQPFVICGPRLVYWWGTKCP